MTASELSDRISSYELTEWQAFERAYGPLGSGYSDDMLAAIHEKLQELLYLTGGLWSSDNTVNAPQRVPRPHEVFGPPTDGEAVLDIHEFNTLMDE